MQDELRQYFTRLESVEAKVETIDKRVHIVEKTLAVQGLQSTVCDHFLDVPLNVPNFTGREDILKDIYSKLPEDNSDDLFTAVCLNGLGGVGKTSIAVRYAHLNRHNYESILWLQADDLHNSLQTMCEYFDISSNSQSKPKVMVQKPCRKIKKSKCLFVLDNAKNFNSIDAYLKNLNLEKKPHVIVTSQQSDWSNLGGGQITTGVFTETEAIKFFDEVATDMNSVKKLVEELENLPLAMQLSLSYIKKHSMSVAKYLEAFCEEKSQLFHENTTSNKALLTVWKMAFEKLKLHEDRVSINILNMMAYMNNTFINMNTFLFYDEVLNEIMLNRVVDILCEYSLVTKRDTNLKTGKVVTIHKLIQRVLKEFEELSSLDLDHLSLLIEILKSVSTQQTNEFDIDNENLWFIHMKHVFNNNEVQIETLPGKFQTVAIQRGEEAIRHHYVVEYLTVNFNSENVDSPLDCVFVLANWMKEHCHFNEAFRILDEMIEGVHKECTEVEKTSTMFLLFQMRCISLKYDSGHKKKQ
ncbi:uncharacterized protein LOC130656790 [Hydractinia symbiolongicarpus]|uniref:uncharacterized protein LOC130656790 n=1 Tax=Hydractinia symbiolongicarpus TaxID=13093 RepID=UPI00254BF581|nr:uncharacterized protein LOC130656790 [Hydractinia symbiolongicarpus]